MSVRTRVGEILVKAGVIDELQLRSALARQDQWGGRLGKIVAEMGLAEEDSVADAISHAAALPRESLGHLPKDALALSRLDVQFAEQKGVFPVRFKDHGKTLVLAMADPTDLEVVDQAAMKSRARISPVVAGETEIQQAILQHYHHREPSSPPVSRARRAVETASAIDRRPVELNDSAFGDNGAPVRSAAPAESATSSPGAGALLDELLGGGTSGLSAEEAARLEELSAQQAKSAKILLAVTELLREKGLLAPQELESKLQR